MEKYAKSVILGQKRGNKHKKIFALPSRFWYNVRNGIIQGSRMAYIVCKECNRMIRKCPHCGAVEFVAAPPNAKELLAYIYVHMIGMTHEMAAERMGVARSTVTTWLVKFSEKPEIHNMFT